MLRFDAGRGRFVLRLQDADGTQLRAKPANIEVVAVALPVGLAVEVGGLVGAAEHNGKRETVVGGPDPKSGRYKVVLDDTNDGAPPLRLKPANLRHLPGLEAPLRV
eukprot:SAG22_NODE_64_length_23238_cov_83.185566_10_plen_106_part_00